MEMAVLRAARAGALDDLRGMLTDNRALVLRAADIVGRSAFYLACRGGHAEVVSFLLGVPASISAAQRALVRRRSMSRARTDTRRSSTCSSQQPG